MLALIPETGRRMTGASLDRFGESSSLSLPSKMELRVGFASLERGKIALRQSRERQRDLKQAAQAAVDRDVNATGEPLRSFSHSRGVAMATGLWPDPPGFRGAIGCDVEYIDARRSWREIGVFLSGDGFAGHALQACQAWTLAEAWFKAFGKWPARTLISRALDAGGADGETIALASSLYWFRTTPCPGFAASVVWRGDPVTPLILSD